MADDTTTTTPDTSSKKSKSSSGNCTGELKQLPYEAGTTNQRYECQTCHQIVTVSAEDLALSGLPPEHSPTPAATE